ncbi:restriction endonuclease subunit S [Gelidibacter pelagius]|uniref:Restriction endonuclease subunit S n=1 Tax=Gelidibacter pelagius TaxID=2819985 RepID=A0ABS3SSB6_9FLAO|nr:restriction endonuclease subunit S [Gelidibacter pelagius]MBO3097837.1 restriction endonuclease subunit S [Gelidibacter pelagius]
MGKWKEVKLKDVIEVINGRAYKKAELLDKGKYPVLRVGNLFTNNNWYHSDLELNENKYCDNGDLIYAWSASFGPRIWNGKKVIYHYHIWKMICDEKKLNKDYAFRFLDWDKDMMQKEHSRGVGMFHLTKSAIENRKLVLPPLPEQQRIVVKLDALFVGIEQAIDLLEENIAHTQALMGSVLDEEFGRLEETEFEPFLNSVFIQNKTLIPKDDETYKYVGLENIESNTGKLVDYSETIGETIKSSKVYFENENVLYGKLRPYLNKVWVSNFDGVATTEILPFKTNQDKLLPRYLAYYLRSNTFLNVVNANVSGARMPRASARFFKDIAEVPKVDLKHQEKMITKFDKLFNHFEDMISLETQKLTHLKSLKSSLLDQAFKGEL